MTALEIILIIILWIILGIYLAYKQKQCLPRYDRILGSIIIMVSPLWLIGAIIRQVFIETWK